MIDEVNFTNISLHKFFFLGGKRVKSPQHWDDWPRMRWYPPQEDTGVAAIATTFSNQATAELEDMKRYPVMT